MSALLDDAPVYVLPDSLRQPTAARPALRLVPTGDVVEPVRVPLRSLPAERPVRLTRRGVLVLSAAVAALAVALVGFAWLSAPTTATPAPQVTARTVAVAPGDTLWSIAGRVAPTRDPRQEVGVLQRLNHLGDSANLVPGQVLHVH